MTTAAAPAPIAAAGPRSSPVAEHWWLLLTLAVIVAGFWPSFFDRLRAQDVAHSLHGFTSTGWLVGLIVQSVLIARGARAAHRGVALAMIPMAVAMVVTAVPMMGAMLRTGIAEPGFMPIARVLTVVDVVSLALFVGLLSVALVNVRRPPIHRRALASTALLGVSPGLTRLLAGAFGVPFMVALHASFIYVYAVLAWLIWQDRRAGVRDRVHPVVLVLVAVMQLVMVPLAATGWWSAVTDSLAR